MRTIKEIEPFIDSSYIPDEALKKSACTETSLDAPEGNRKHLLNYFIKKKLKVLNGK